MKRGESHGVGYFNKGAAAGAQGGLQSIGRSFDHYSMGQQNQSTQQV